MTNTSLLKLSLLVAGLAMIWSSPSAQAQTITGVNITSHNHVSSNFNNDQLLEIGATPNDADIENGDIGVVESPFFALATPANGLAGDLGFNNNPNLADVPATATTANLSGTFTIVGSSTAAGGFDDGNGLPTGVTATYTISFALSTTTGALLSAGLSEANGLGAGNGDAFFTPTNGNFSGDLVFGAATISEVSFTGTPADAGFVLSNGSVDSIDLVGLSSASFNGTNDAILMNAAGDTVVEFTTDATEAGQVLIDITNDNLFQGQELGDAVLAVTNGGLHVRGITLGANFSYDIEESEGGLPGDVNLDGVVDFFDIQPFIEILTNQGFQLEADIDGSGVVDFFDITPFIGLLGG